MKIRPTGVVAGRRPRERAHVAELHVVGTRTVQIIIESKSERRDCDLFSFIFRRHYFIATASGKQTEVSVVKRYDHEMHRAQLYHPTLVDRAQLRYMISGQWTRNTSMEMSPKNLSAAERSRRPTHVPFPPSRASPTSKGLLQSSTSSQTLTQFSRSLPL